MCMYAPKTHEVDADYWIDNRVYSGTVTQVNSESHLLLFGVAVADSNAEKQVKNCLINRKTVFPNSRKSCCCCLQQQPQTVPQLLKYLSLIIYPDTSS